MPDANPPPSRPIASSPGSAVAGLEAVGAAPWAGDGGCDAADGDDAGSGDAVGDDGDVEAVAGVGTDDVP